MDELVHIIIEENKTFDSRSIYAFDSYDKAKDFFDEKVKFNRNDIRNVADTYTNCFYLERSRDEDVHSWEAKIMDDNYHEELKYKITLKRCYLNPTID